MSLYAYLTRLEDTLRSRRDIIAEPPDLSDVLREIDGIITLSRRIAEATGRAMREFVICETSFSCTRLAL